jgi:hypothetical protein
MSIDGQKYACPVQTIILMIMTHNNKIIAIYVEIL